MVEFPEHHIYLELTGIYSSMFLKKPISPNDIVVDVNNMVLKLYHQLANNFDTWAKSFPREDSFLDQWIKNTSTYNPSLNLEVSRIVEKAAKIAPNIINIYKHIRRVQWEFDSLGSNMKRYSSSRTLVYADYTNIDNKSIDEKIFCLDRLKRSRSMFVFKDCWYPEYKLPEDTGIEVRRL
jgi:hypothetical protein